MRCVLERKFENPPDSIIIFLPDMLVTEMLSAVPTFVESTTVSESELELEYVCGRQAEYCIF